MFKAVIFFPIYQLVFFTSLFLWPLWKDSKEQKEINKPEKYEQQHAHKLVALCTELNNFFPGLHNSLLESTSTN